MVVVGGGGGGARSLVSCDGWNGIDLQARPLLMKC